MRRGPRNRRASQCLTRDRRLARFESEGRSSDTRPAATTLGPGPQSSALRRSNMNVMIDDISHDPHIFFLLGPKRASDSSRR